MSKVFLYNPQNGSPIKNWYDGSERWSLEIDEVKGFPTQTANALRGVFGFLQEVSEQDSEALLLRLEEKEKNPTTVRLDGSGDFVPKPESEIKAELEEIKKKKEVVKKVLAKVKKAPEAKPENPSYDEMNRGEVFAECVKRGIEIKGLGKSRVSKEQLVALLINDDNK